MIDLGARERGERLFGLAAGQLAALLGLRSRGLRLACRLGGRRGVLGLDHRKRRLQPCQATAR